MNYTEIKDNKRISKDNNFLFEQFKDHAFPMSALSLLFEELSFLGDPLGRKRVFTHKQIPQLVIKIDLKKNLLLIFHKGKKTDTLTGFTTTEQFTKYKINDTDIFTYEETFNFIINKIRTLWGSN